MAFDHVFDTISIAGTHPLDVYKAPKDNASFAPHVDYLLENAAAYIKVQALLDKVYGQKSKLMNSLNAIYTGKSHEIYPDEIEDLQTLFSHHPALLPMLHAFDAGCTTIAQDDSVLSYLDWGLHDFVDMFYALDYNAKNGNHIQSLNIAGNIGEIRAASPNLGFGYAINRSPLSLGEAGKSWHRSPWMYKTGQQLGKSFQVAESLVRGEELTRLKSTFATARNDGSTLPLIARHALETSTTAKQAFSAVATAKITAPGILTASFRDAATNQNHTAAIYRLATNTINGVTAVIHTPKASFDKVRTMFAEQESVAVILADYGPSVADNLVVSTNCWPEEVAKAFGNPKHYDRAELPKKRLQDALEIARDDNWAEFPAKLRWPSSKAITHMTTSQAPGAAQRFITLKDELPYAYAQLDVG